MKCLPLIILLLAVFQTGSNTAYALPTHTVEVAAEKRVKTMTRTELRAKRKELRKEWRAARKAGADRTEEERLARRSSIALLFAILSIPLTALTGGLILLGTMPYTRKTLTAYLYNPEVEVGYQRARAARFIAVALTALIVTYLAIFAVALLSFL